MLAPDPALAGPTPTSRPTAPASAPASSATAAAGPTALEAALSALPVFDLLADVAQPAARGVPLPDGRPDGRPDEAPAPPDPETSGGVEAIVAGVTWPIAPPLIAPPPIAPQAIAPQAIAPEAQAPVAAPAVDPRAPEPGMPGRSLVAPELVRGPVLASVSVPDAVAPPVPGSAPATMALPTAPAAQPARPFEPGDDVAAAEARGDTQTVGRQVQPGADTATSFVGTAVASATTPGPTLTPTTPVPGVVSWQFVPQPAAGTASAPAPEAAPLAPDPQVRPEALAGQVAVAVGKDGHAARKVELRLDPPELGRVEIHLSPTEKGGMHAIVLAERPETHDLLRRHADVLARELGNAGYSDVNLSFSAGTDAGVGRGLPAPIPERGAFALATGDAPGSGPAAPLPQPHVDGALDIRL